MHKRSNRTRLTGFLTPVSPPGESSAVSCTIHIAFDSMSSGWVAQFCTMT